MITRRQFSKLGLGFAAFSSSAHQLFAQPGLEYSDSPSGKIPREGTDIRRVGVRVNGDYWGMDNENIDMLSGNLCYSLPILKAIGSSEKKDSTDVVCSYNSQIWKKDHLNTYLHGINSGYGFGWKIQFGSIVPRIIDGKIVGYTYIDGTGAEYPLALSRSIKNIWVCLQGLFISYDPETSCLMFPNGEFWIMECVSSDGEPDAGARYPTLIQDTNGNQIWIGYMPGSGSQQLDSSSRIQEIRDARAVETSAGQRSYSFVYTQDKTPHLSAIVSHVAYGQSFLFSYDTQQLRSPFDNSDLGSVNVLKDIQISSTRKHSFAYNNSGELVEVQNLNGGCLRWEYATYSFVQERCVREVALRSIATSLEAEEAVTKIVRENKDGNALIHSSAILQEPDQSTEKQWFFCNDVLSPYLGLATSFEERGNNRNTVLRRTNYAWAHTTAGAPYQQCVEKILDPDTADEVRSKTEFERDIFGNLTEQRQYNYNELEKPFKITRHAYLTDSDYILRNIFDRLVSTSISDGVNTTESVKNKYDTTQLVNHSNALYHDSRNCGISNTVRGNLTESWYDNVVEKFGYDIAGVVAFKENSDGKRTEVVPTEIKRDVGIDMDPNATPDMADFLVKSRWQEIDSKLHSYTRRNGEKVSSSYGDKFICVFNDKRWRKVTYDGFSRILSIEQGEEEETLSTVEYDYNPSDSLGSPKDQRDDNPTFYKPKRESLPHAPNMHPEWIEYDYDGLGRFIQSGNRKLTYKGNTTTIIDTEGGWKKLIRNADDLLQKVITPNPQAGPDLETIYRYNLQGKLTSVTMPRLDGTQKREFISKPEEREREIRHAEKGPERRKFNENGTLAWKMDAKGQKTAYAYDDKKRRVSVDRFDASGQIQHSQCVRYFYDSNPFDPDFSQNAEDNLVAVQWGSLDSLPGLMTEMYSYTEKGRKAAKRLRFNRGGDDLDLDLAYTYDEDEKLLFVDYPHGGPSLKYDYDSSGRPCMLTSGSDILVKDALYDDRTGRLVSYKQLVQKSGEYLEHTREFDSKLQLSRFTAGFEEKSDPIVDIEYEYDSIRRLRKKTDYLSDDVTSFEYDKAGHLKLAGNADWEVEYGYDGFGNRLSQQNNKGTVPELIVDHDPETNHIVSDAVRYDENGNIIRLFDMNLTFDIQNRLVEIERQGEGSEYYEYNPSNLRIWKKLATGEEEIHFYGTGGRRIATYKLTVDAHGNGNVTFQDCDIYFAGNLLCSNNKPVVLDRLGSVHAWIDDNKNVQCNNHYPFGEARQASKQDRSKFTNYIRDNFSELDYAEQRYYSSTLGRFITTDPFEGSAWTFNPDSWNRYAYCLNDPVNLTDPHGLIWTQEGGFWSGTIWLDDATCGWIIFQIDMALAGAGVIAAYLGAGPVGLAIATFLVVAGTGYINNMNQGNGILISYQFMFPFSPYYIITSVESA